MIKFFEGIVLLNALSRSLEGIIDEEITIIFDYIINISISFEIFLKINAENFESILIYKILYLLTVF